MYTSEKIFIMKFLAGLKKLGITEIPYDNSLILRSRAVEFTNDLPKSDKFFVAGKH